MLAEPDTKLENATRFCPECKAELNKNAEICTKCGLIQPATVSPPKPIGRTPTLGGKRPIVAAVLALVFMPAGYWYVKRLKRWIIVFLITLVMGVLFKEVGVYIMVAIAIYDVYKIAKNEPAPFDFLNKRGLG